MVIYVESVVHVLETDVVFQVHASVVHVECVVLRGHDEKPCDIFI
jgi:hypothetical protein